MRSIRKYFRILRSYAVRLGFLGAKIKGVTPAGNTLLKLNKNYPLGFKGSIIQLPRDKMIYEFVKNRGFWELEESKFLAKGLIKANKLSSGRKTALLDIGAYTGLVTLQALNLSNTNNEVFLFEPIERHIIAIKHNLRNYENININNFALGSQNGKSTIFTEASNHGNSSLIKSKVDSIGQIQTVIKIADTKEYCDTSLTKFESYVIKCDTQGMDALILSRIPKRIWEKVECAVLEVWALPEICDLDVNNLLLMCENFQYISWYPKSEKILDISEVGKFWLGKSGAGRNLYLSRTL